MRYFNEWPYFEYLIMLLICLMNICFFCVFCVCIHDCIFIFLCFEQVHWHVTGYTFLFPISLSRLKKWHCLQTFHRLLLSLQKGNLPIIYLSFLQYKPFPFSEYRGVLLPIQLLSCLPFLLITVPTCQFNSILYFISHRTIQKLLFFKSFVSLINSTNWQNISKFVKFADDKRLGCSRVLPLNRTIAESHLSLLFPQIYSQCCGWSANRLQR